LCRNCLLKHAIAGKKEGKYKGWDEVKEDVSSYEWLSGKENMMEFLRGGTSLNFIGNSLCKKYGRVTIYTI